ncbi:MAG: UDP-N-acetylglucosamine 1-carboxyvinyltransferase [Candidatus Omnitrophica bacterium]|nr:UDP-N-acetylglucosamine 1-carboxyvinyltransferase [Candidatus Omnitrophota bacterium]
MQKLVIQPSGPLRGTVAVGGAKNDVLPIMAACLLTEETSVIEGVPQVSDVLMMADILRELGVAVELNGPQLTITPGRYSGTTATYDLVSKMRASVCVLGPLLAKQGEAQVSIPGGCVIGPRPIDLHLKGLQALGAAISSEHGYVVAAGLLHGARVHLAGAHGSSVLATGNVMMAATLAEGTTVIEQAACEPEVADLVAFLCAMGARVEGAGTPVIRIDGVRQLHGARHQIIPDRIEAGTLMLAGAVTHGEVVIDGARADHVAALSEKLREAGVEVDVLDGAIRVRAPRRLSAVDVTTLPYPGFPTDLQAPIMALLATAQGVSVLTEKIYPERFMHVAELNRMGASIAREGASAIVKGVPRLSGVPVTAPDLRAAAALVLAALAADHQTELSGLEHLDRGYQHLEEQLRQLGAVLERVEIPSARQAEGVPGWS